jgi:UDP-2,3-diacylglucosamine pyrophosphatase LpxH
MISLGELMEKSDGKLQVYMDFRLEAAEPLTEKLTVCVPDVHLLEKGATDDFIDGKVEHEKRFLDLLDFLLELKTKEGEDMEVVQLGDMFDLWQAKGNTNLIEEAYPDILGLLDKMKTVYVVGNHDIDLVKWYEDKGETFGRKWRHYSNVDTRRTAIYEHGFQADFANNQESLSGAIGREVTKIVGMMEYISPDIDVVLGKAWESVSRAFSKYNVFTPVRDPESFNLHEHLNFYIDLLEKYNAGQTMDHLDPAQMNLSLAVIGHTHTARLVQMPKGEKIYYLMDCGSWVNGGHEIGIVAGRDLAVCQWG